MVGCDCVARGVAISFQFPRLEQSRGSQQGDIRGLLSRAYKLKTVQLWRGNFLLIRRTADNDINTMVTGCRLSRCLGSYMLLTPGLPPTQSGGQALKDPENAKLSPFFRNFGSCPSSKEVILHPSITSPPLRKPCATRNPHEGYLYLLTYLGTNDLKRLILLMWQPTRWGGRSGGNIAVCLARRIVVHALGSQHPPWPRIRRRNVAESPGVYKP